jgi:hypothetical protein
MTILQEIDAALANIFAGGSPLAKDSAAITQFIPVLRQLGGQTPVFNALADRLETAATEASPEAVMEARLLLCALRRTQCKTKPEKEAAEFPYAQNPLAEKDISYLKLQSYNETIRANQNTAYLKELYKSGLYADTRFLDAYCVKIKTSTPTDTEFLRETIMPALGEQALKERVLFHVKKHFSPKNRNVGWSVRFLALYNDKDTLLLAKAALQEAGNDNVIAEILDALGTCAEAEELIRSYADYQKWVVRAGVVKALAKIARAAKWDNAKFNEAMEPFLKDTSENVRKAAQEAVAQRKKETSLLGSFLQTVGVKRKPPMV